MTLGEHKPPSTRPVLSNIAIGWLGATLLLLPVAAVAVLLIALGSSDVPGLIEAIQTAAIAGLGLTGVAALLLAARRQRGLELERRDRHRAAEDAAAARERREHTDVETRRDALREHATVLYARAVDQLGSERAAVRVAGLYLLERLAQDSAAHRQIVVDVLCAYLRLPPEATGEHFGPQEREVRLTAQRILHRSLFLPAGDDAEAAAGHRPAADVDLTGARLEDFTLTGCDIASARFDGALFRGGASMDRTRFRGPATFEGARFTADVSFTGTRFDSLGCFSRAQADGDTRFTRAEFAGDAVFERMRFGAAARFEEARFAGRAEFGEVEFVGPAMFRRAWFGSSAGFDGTRFGESAVFDQARFDGDARFGRAQFVGTAEFTGARADDVPDRPSSWPQGWRTRAAEDVGHLAVLEAAPGDSAVTHAQS